MVPYKKKRVYVICSMQHGQLAKAFDRGPSVLLLDMLLGVGECSKLTNLGVT